jgi:hypothetical protein
VGHTFSQDEFKMKWKGVTKTLTADDFAVAFKRWLQRCKKIVCIAVGMLKKMLENIFDV